MNRVKDSIGWADYTINPVKGLCPMACTDNRGKEYCYARRLYGRFKWNPEIRLEPEVMSGVYLSHIKPSRIFVGSTVELFGEWVKPEWLKYIFEMCKVFPQHTFIFLTKRPQELARCSPFPDNCCIGVSITDGDKLVQAVDALDIIQCSARFLSIEPLLGSVEQKNHYLPLLFQGTLDWVIVGQQTPPSKKTEPKIEWMREILEAADKASIPVFLKNNLLTLFPYGFLKETEGKAMAIDFKLPQWAGFDGKLRQEFPDVQKIQAK